MALVPDQQLDGKYRVLRLIGEGGMGTVYEGQNVRIGRRVAIKVLHAHVASRPEFAARFEREAKAAALIGSPHICDVLDLGDLPSGERFIVMEFLDGESLEHRLARVSRVTGDQLLPIAWEMLEALATMHAAGVIHRDLKPANVFLTRSSQGRGEVVKVLDFGVSKFMEVDGESGKMTSTGMLMGTPLYMSPEQARGAREIDARSDLYSASVVFYRALTGVLPFESDNFNELMFKIALEDAKPIRELAPSVDEALAAIVTRGMARAPNDRYESAKEYQKALVQWARKQGRSSFSLFTSPSEKALAAAVDGAPSARPAALAQSSGSKDGTPTAWSEDGPVLAASGADKGGTLVVAPTVASAPPTPIVTSTKSGNGSLTSEAAPAPSQATMGSSAAPTPAAATTGAPPTPSRSFLVPAIAGIALVAGIAGVIIAAKGFSAASTTTISSASAATVTPTVPAAPPPSPSPSPLPSTPPDLPSASPQAPSASVTAEPSPPRVATTPPPRRTATTAEPPPAASSAAVAPPQPTQAPSAAPSGSSKTRKFRTNID